MNDDWIKILEGKSERNGNDNIAYLKKNVCERLIFGIHCLGREDRCL